MNHNDIITIIALLGIVLACWLLPKGWRWLRRDNLVAELTEETIRLSDLAGGLRKALAECQGDASGLGPEIIDSQPERSLKFRDLPAAELRFIRENDDGTVSCGADGGEFNTYRWDGGFWVKVGSSKASEHQRRIAELEAASRTDHQTIGDLHERLEKSKRQLATAKGQVSRLKKLAGVPVKAPARKRGGK